MAKLLYVEPSDEITDLVDRIRRAEGERDLVFVVPPEGHVLRSPLDMRLLMQYTRGFQKRIAIVSGDPQIQALAMRTGFPTFPSLARLEQGAPLRGVPVTAAAGAAATAAATSATLGGPAATGEEPAPSTALSRRGPTALRGTAAGAAAGGWLDRLRGWWSTQRGHNLTLIGGLGVFVVGLLAVLFILPAATITLGVPAHRLSDTVTIQGTIGTQTGQTLDQIPTVALQSSTYSKSFTITPSGTQQLAPVPATGSLVFCLTSASPVTGPTLSFTAGTSPEFVYQGSSGVSFTTTSSGAQASVSLPQCSSGYSSAVSVQADTSTVGTAGNVSPSTWTWSNASSTQCVSSSNDPGTCWPTTLPMKVVSQSAMSGGKNATTQSVFSTSDVSSAQTQLQSIETSLTTKAEQQLNHQAGKLVVAKDSSGHGVTVTVNAPTLPTGCNTTASTPCPAGSSQNLSVSVSAAGTAYSPSVARAAVLQDLRSRVPADSELLADPSIGTPRVVSAGAGGTVTLTAQAVGYWAAKLDLKPLQSKLAFMSPSSARSYLLAQLPGASTVKISQFPFGLPWLPIFSGRIQLVRVSISKSHHTG